ncbi:MAG: hypothetical protein WEB50_00760 [Vicinamibacterales bacterium]
MLRKLQFLALALLLLLAAAGRHGSSVEAQAPKPVSKMMYVLPHYLQATGSFENDVASLRQRLGEGRFVRVGFSHFVSMSMTDWNVNVTDRAAVRNALGSTISTIDSLVARARSNNIPINLSILTAIRERIDPVQFEAGREDRRNMS